MFGKKDKQESGKYPYILFEVEENGNVMIRANWPASTNEEEAHRHIHAIAGLTILLNDGKLTPGIEQAITLFGNNHNEQGVAQAILNTIKGLLATRTIRPGPVVKPTEVFNMREGNQ
jgi:hypothetical protein